MRIVLTCVAVLSIVSVAAAEGVLSDIMSGALVDPEVGVYAWYELKDAKTGNKLFMRQAIVGQKEVGVKTGYYLETEVVPEIGFPVLYRLLLTGPASDAQNVHEILVREGTQPPQSLAPDILASEKSGGTEGDRASTGMEKITTPAGDMEAEHFVISQGLLKTEVWVNKTIRPMGIVKMISPDGELLLTRYGEGGRDAESAMDRKAPEEAANSVSVRVNKGPKKNFKGKDMP